ncbi:restriction endonuclease [Vibrio vulnificus]|uniref:restriction endonuclease n=1 Tax=Vibrio vulnificus TaxID=672 RepID=UPI00102A0A34|nr:restriction endonuclease [Vibrio vulnificus]RZP63335.1 restriction endonuclease [Vibrio vulnificus]
MANNGRDYESFVQVLQQAILDSEEFIKQKNIRIEANKKIVDNSGVSREFDLYWEYELAGVTYKTVIECKDYNSKIPMEKIDALIGKTRDIPDLKAIFATKVGYQSGAIERAKFNKIDLLVVRKQNDGDWTDSDGNPVITEICAMLQIVSAATIVSCRPEIDGNWVKENTSLDVTKPFQMQMRNDETFIEDLESGETYSLLQLEERLGHNHKGKSGVYDYKQSFSNAFIVCGSHRLKLRSLNLKYSISNPMEFPINIDYTQELLGVVEYLHHDKKTAVFASGINNDW